MKRDKDIWLMGRAATVVLIGILAALVAAQWKHEAVPLAALLVVLGLTLAKARWVILDFMGLRRERPGLAVALMAWPLFFALAAAARAAAQALGL